MLMMEDQIDMTVYFKLQYVYVVCSIIGRGVWGVVWSRGQWRSGWSMNLMSPCWLCVCVCVGGDVGDLVGGWSLVSPCWVCEWCLSVWRGGVRGGVLFPRGNYVCCVCVCV